MLRAVDSRVTVSGHVITGRATSMHVPKDETEHVDVMVLPAYGRKAQGNGPQQTVYWQCLTLKGSYTYPRQTRTASLSGE